MIEYELEPGLYLAPEGHFTDSERVALIQRGNEARARIGTGAQRGELRSATDGAPLWVGRRSAGRKRRRGPETEVLDAWRRREHALCIHRSPGFGMLAG